MTKPQRQLEGVLRKIVGFHQDAELEWVAELECGHTQLVPSRLPYPHSPPFTIRHWVTRAEGRQAHIGQELRCLVCRLSEEQHS